MQSKVVGWMPETLGGQVQILYWSASEVVVPLFILIFGMLAGFYKMSFVAVIAYCYVYAKLKDRIPKGYAINLLYILGILNFTTAPSYFADKFEE